MREGLEGTQQAICAPHNFVDKLTLLSIIMNMVRCNIA